MMSDDKVARLLTYLDGATSDRELVERYDRTVEELMPDPEALAAFLAEASGTERRGRVNAARDRYMASLAEAVKADQKRRWDAAVCNAFKVWLGAQDRQATSVHGNELRAAERQMTEHERAMFGDLFEKLVARLAAEDVDLGGSPTEADIIITLRELLSEDSEAREIAERLGVLALFRDLPDSE